MEGWVWGGACRRQSRRRVYFLRSGTRHVRFNAGRVAARDRRHTPSRGVRRRPRLCALTSRSRRREAARTKPPRWPARDWPRPSRQRGWLEQPAPRRVQPVHRYRTLRRCAVHSHLRDQRIGSTNRDTSGAARSHATGKGGLGGRHKTGYLPSYKRLLAPPQPRDDPTHRRRRYRPLRHPPRRLKSHRLASSAPAPPALPCGLEAP